MAELPTGTVTFIFTDIEGSTRLLQALRDRYSAALAQHRALLRGAFTSFGGTEVDTQGDAFFVAFPTPQGALQAAVQAQRALADHPWPEQIELRVRMGIHTGTPEVTEQGYVGADVHLGARICAAAWGGQILVSPTTAAHVSSALDDVTLRALGHHALKDIGERVELSQVIVPGLRQDFPPLRTTGTHPTNLPPRLPPLIGRDADIATVTELLGGDDVSLVTLGGPGGTGKTRLALATGAELLSSFADGVFFVDLSALSDPALVIPAIARALSLRETPGRTLQQTLADHLASKEMLLIVDNFEQIMDAAPDISDLVTQAPSLKVLVTSRETLRIQEERVFSLAPLELPSPDHDDVAEVALSPAVALFTERARAVKADFTVTADNASEVAAIVRRLDGLPLALELAAARANLLSPAALLARLDQGLKVLTSGRRDAAERQRTLKGAIAWSYGLLSEDEQILFRRLGVFAGGCGLEGAEEVCDRGDLTTDVLDGLASLVDKSLVRAAGDQERFTMLETIREFALETLEESGEAEDIRRAHAELFTQLAEEAEPHLIGPEQKRWLDVLEAAHDNIRAAVQWAIEEDSAMALELVSGVWRFWWVRGHLTEGRGWLEAALRHAGAIPAVRAQALRAVSFITRSQGDRATARRAAEEARAVSASIGDRLGVARALDVLGSAASEDGELDEASTYATQARDLYEELGDREGVAVTTANLGNIALIQGDFVRAGRLAEESLQIHREHGHKEGMAASELNVGFAAMELGGLERADASFSRALDLSRDLGHRELEFAALEALAASAARGGRSDEAATLLGGAEALRQVGGFARERYEQRLYEGTRALIDR